MNTFSHNKEAYKDLSIGKDIFKALDKTITQIGSKKLKHRLNYCSSNTKYLEKLALQNYTIYQDKTHQAKMTEFLRKIKTLEGFLDDWIVKKCDDSLVYKWSIFNNRVFLSTSNRLKFSSILIVLVIYVLIYLYLYYHDYYISPTDYVKGIVQGYYAFLEVLCSMILSNYVWIENTALILTSVYVGYQLYTTYQAINTNYEHYKLCNSFYNDYSKIAEYIKTIDEMTKTDVYSDTTKVKKSIDYLKYYFTDSSSLGFSLITKLDPSSYTKHIDIVINYVGRVDCQMCISKLIDDGFTVPRFIQSDFPVLHINEVWNPMISVDKIVKNSLIMNVNTPNVAIITGPNKAGKSTFMRSVITSVYLAQSLGISCADKISLTPFRDVFTYLNVPDCVGRESLFEAELNRCYTYIEKTESFRGFSLGIVDELFTGTNPTEGKASSYAILKRISQNPTNITILSTHFHDVIDDLDKSDFKFFKFFATKKDDTFNFDYKIKEGVSDQCIALELLKQRGFNEDIVNDALQFMNKNNAKK